jgi:septum site-determining protein MinC
MKKNEIILKVNEEATQEEIIESLEKKLPVLKNLYKEAKNPIRVTGKFLRDKEMEEIKSIIKKAINVNIEFDNVNELGLSGIKKAYEQDVENSQTYFFKGGIRSGQRIETEGSIVILGDVNNGAEVIAEENIVILGVLRGLAHAGAKGNKKAIIATHRIECPQLRIANILKEMEKEELEETKQFASVKEDHIILE